MKKLAFVFVLALAVCSSFAQSVQSLKSRVCIVREVYFDETKVFCDELQDTLNRSGYPNYAEYVEKYVGNVSGSGYVYVADDGRNYVITNRHVVSKCEGATVEFVESDGTTKKYENLTVIATDEDLDIAILEFENGSRPFKTGLSFSKTPVSDGEDVWTAGYPGLGKDLVWQFGKGNITNASVKIKELLDPEISSLIQHSAPVDSGNSGGPLLRQKNGAYEIVGMNTWKYFYRQSANISIPSAAILKFINEALSAKKTGATVEGLKSRLESLKKLFEKENTDPNAKDVPDDEKIYFRDLSKYISFDFIKASGIKSFLKNMKTASSNDRNAIRGAFTSYSPIEGVSYSVSLDVYAKFHGDSFLKNAEIEEPVKKDNGDYTVKIKNGEKAIDTTWTFETLGVSGFWRLSYCDFEKTEKETKSKKSNKTKTDSSSESSKDSGEKSDSKGSSKNASNVKIGNPYKLSLLVDIIPNLDKDAKKFGVIGGIAYKPVKFFGLTASAGGQKVGDDGAFSLLVGLFVEIPVMINDFALIPYVQGGLEIVRPVGQAKNIWDGERSSTFLGFDLEAGLKIGYSFDTVFPFVFAAYNMQSARDFMGDKGSLLRNGVSFGLGVGFDF